MSEWLSRLMVKEGIIEEEDRDIYMFGIRNGFIILLNLFTAFLIGLFTTKLLLVAVFTIAFMTLRSYTGGYHSESHVFCYISSSLVLFIPIYTVPLFYEATIPILAAILTVSVIIILILSPMDSRKRKLDQEERIHFRKRARVILLVQMMVLGIFYASGNMALAYAIYSSICLIAVFMLIGELTLKLQLHMEE